jgi:hypothetical protein
MLLREVVVTTDMRQDIKMSQMNVYKRAIISWSTKISDGQERQYTFKKDTLVELGTNHQVQK